MPRLRIRLLGGLEVSFAGEPLPPIPSRAGRALLAYLALQRERPHARERLAARFWPDLDPARARRRLSHTLWQVQDVLGEPATATSFLTVTPDTLAVDPAAPIWIDTAEFEERVERFRPVPGAPRRLLAGDLAELAEAVELYRGDLLSGFSDEWLLPEQERFRQLHLDALSWLVDLAKAQGSYDDALVYARRITHHDPLREDVHREVMRLCTLLGRTSDALRQYERVRSVLDEELGTPPARSTTQLYEFIARHRDAPTATAGAAAARPDGTRLVDRDRERATAVAALERTLAGRGGALFLEGEPGVGKSRLAEQVAADAYWRGCAVATGQGAGSTAAPYGTMVQALGRELTAVRAEQLRPLVEAPWLVEAARVLPQLGRVAGDATSARLSNAQESAERMRTAIVRVLTGLAALDPFVLVLEDVHDADRESLQVLEELGPALVSQPLLVVLTFRSEEVRHRAEAWSAVRRLDAEVGADRLVLAPLSSFGTAELVREHAPAATTAGLAARLHRETGGNPLFVLETLQAMAERGARGDAEPIPLAGGIRDLVATRTAGLPEGSRLVLATAAVAGALADVDVLLAATEAELAPGEVADALRELGRRALLIEGEAYSFRHELVRRAVLDALAPPRRAELHGRVARALEQHHPGATPALAHHHEAAGDRDAAVLAHRRAAEEALAVHAYATAGQHLERAARLQRAGLHAVDGRRALLLRYEEVLDVLGDREGQAAVLDELGGLVGADAEGRRELARRQALLAANTDRWDAAEAAADEALGLATDGPSRVAALTAAGRIRAWRGAHDRAVPLLQEAVELAEEDRDAADAGLALGVALSSLQRYREAIPALEHAQRVLAGLGDPRGEVDALGALAWIRAETGDTPGAVGAYEQAIERCRAIGYRHGTGVNLVNLANARYRAGDVGTALGCYDEAGRVFRELGNDRGTAMVQLNASAVRAAVLDDDRADGEAREALAYFRRIADGAHASSCLETLASLALRRGRAEEAAALLAEAREGLRAAGDLWERAHLARGDATVALARDDPERALRHLDEGLETCQRGGLDEIAVVLRGLRGPALLALGDPQGALRTTTAATEDLRDGVERPYLVWWWHHLAAAAAGHEAVARAALHAARDGLHGLLGTLPPDLRLRALEVTEHRTIELAWEAILPPAVEVPMAAVEAPTGRALAPAELRPVRIELPPAGPEEDPIATRRRWLRAAVDQARSQGAAPTVRDLADVLGVSPATVRRDLRALRDAGHEVRTRASRAS